MKYCREGVYQSFRVGHDGGRRGTLFTGALLQGTGSFPFMFRVRSLHKLRFCTLTPKSSLPTNRLRYNYFSTRPMAFQAPLDRAAGPLVWIDCEMTGLDHKKDKIIEIAVRRSAILSWISLILSKGSDYRW